MPDSVFKARESLTLDSTALLQKACRAGRQGSVMLIKHPALPWPEVDCVERNQQSFGRAVHLNQDDITERYSGLQCRSDELPFLDDSFKQVVLWHVIASGQEAELTEACRVLATDGELLILGLNSRGLGTSRNRAATQLPRLKLHALIRRLPELDMETNNVLGAGLLGFSTGVFQQNIWGTLLLPVADLVVIRARAVNPANIDLLRVKQFRTGIAPTA